MRASRTTWLVIVLFAACGGPAGPGGDAGVVIVGADAGATIEDAGRGADAGPVVDAGAPDAGADAGSADAGSSDAGSGCGAFSSLSVDQSVRSTTRTGTIDLALTCEGVTTDQTVRYDFTVSAARPLIEARVVNDTTFPTVTRPVPAVHVLPAQECTNSLECLPPAFGGTASTARQSVLMQLAPGEYSVSVSSAADAGVDFSLLLLAVAEPTALVNGTAVSLSGAAGSTSYYSVEVPVGVASLQVSLTSTSSDDADLYVSRESIPRVRDAEFARAGRGADGLAIASPDAGTYLIGVYTAFGFSNWQLTATY